MSPQRWLELWSERMHNYAHLALSALTTSERPGEDAWVRETASENFARWYRRWDLAFWHFREALGRVRGINEGVVR